MHPPDNCIAAVHSLHRRNAAVGCLQAFVVAGGGMESQVAVVEGGEHAGPGGGRGETAGPGGGQLQEDVDGEQTGSKITDG